MNIFDGKTSIHNLCPLFLGGPKDGEYKDSHERVPKGYQTVSLSEAHTVFIHDSFAPSETDRKNAALSMLICGYSEDDD